MWRWKNEKARVVDEEIQIKPQKRDFESMMGFRCSVSSGGRKESGSGLEKVLQVRRQSDES